MIDGITTFPGMMGQGAGGGATNWVTSSPSSELRNDWLGWVGASFEVGAADIEMTHIGRWIVAGNTDTHELAIWNEPGITKIASAFIDTSAHSPGSFGLVPLSLTLIAGTKYRIGSTEVDGGDQWYQRDAYTTTGVAALSREAYGETDMSASGVMEPNIFGPVTFVYKS